MNPKVFWSWKDSVESNGQELVIEGVISEDSWWGDEATPQQLREELAQHSGPLTVSLNSPGGDVFAGVAMYNALKDFKEEVTIRVDGLAASIASVIAMAGDKVIMNAGSMMMIHKPWTFAFGNADELAKVQEVLLSIEKSIVPIYTARTGKSDAEIQEMLDAETWLTADEAVENGFADEALEPKKSASTSDTIKQMLNGGRLALVNKVTEDSTKHLLDKINAEDAEQEEETPDEEAPADEPNPVETPDEPKDEDEEETPETPEEDEPEQPTEPETPPVEDADDEEEPESEPAKPEESDPEMDPKDKAKKPNTSGVENLQTPTPKQEVAPAQNYIDTPQALVDFAEVLKAHAGADSKEIKNAWKEHLETKMGITNPDVLLPGGVIQSIQDTLEGATGIWGLVNKTGLKVFRTALNTVTGDDSRARGHKRGYDKQEQVITVADRTIRAQFIYKYITLDKETIVENEDTGAVVTYVLTELPKRILAELERAIVIGDGREDDDDDKISSFLSVKEDAASGDGYATEFDGTDDGLNLLETLVTADAEVRADGARYLVISRAELVKLKLSKDEAGAYVFPFGSNVAQAMGYAGVFTPDWMADDDAVAYEVVFDAYNTVGATGIDAYTNFLLSKNKQEYLQEIYAGGALARPRAAVAVVAAS